MMKNWLPRKNIPILRLECNMCKKHSQFMTKMAEIDTLFMTKTADHIKLCVIPNIVDNCYNF